MELFAKQNAGPATADTVYDRVIKDARLNFGDRVPGEQLDSLVRHVVEDMFGHDIRVTTFLPLLAMRDVRDSLDQRSIIG